MGNRAILKPVDRDDIGVYLHWNGGRDSIEAFLKYCEIKNFSGFDDEFGMASFVKIVSNFFRTSDNVGIITCPFNWDTDNGIYVIKGFQIVDRIEYTGEEQNEYDLLEMLINIDKSQPEKEQLGSYLTAEEVDTSSIKIGEQVYMPETDNTYKIYSVVGFFNGQPYVNKYLNNYSYHHNPNNYINTKTVKKRIDKTNS